MTLGSPHLFYQEMVQHKILYQAASYLDQGIRKEHAFSGMGRGQPTLVPKGRAAVGRQDTVSVICLSAPRSIPHTALLCSLFSGDYTS